MFPRNIPLLNSKKKKRKKKMFKMVVQWKHIRSILEAQIILEAHVTCKTDGYSEL